VFYPEASVNRRTAAFLLEVDPVGLVRDRPRARRAQAKCSINPSMIARTLLRHL
jgi:hypothetical protein